MDNKTKEIISDLCMFEEPKSLIGKYIEGYLVEKVTHNVKTVKTTIKLSNQTETVIMTIEPGKVGLVEV